MASYVDAYTALISDIYTWNGVEGQGISATPLFLTYSFATTRPPVVSGISYADSNYFRTLSTPERATFSQAIATWAEVSGITIFEAPAGMGDIEVGAYSLAGNTAGQASLPSSPIYTSDGELRLYAPDDRYTGIWLDSESGMSMHVMLHEIGHSLGLEHPHNGTYPLLAANLDNGANTVMSYNDYFPLLGTLDIQAIQALYGTDTQDGSQVASWNWNSATSTLTQHGTAASEMLKGTDAHDIVYTGGGADLVVARGGNDVIYVSGADFKISAGTGFDVIYLDLARGDLKANSQSGEFTYLMANGAQSWDMTVFQGERLHFTDAVLALDFDGNAGQAYRLYQAAFDRPPDEVGLGYWVLELDRAIGNLTWMAHNFIISDEFISTYGTPASVTNTDFLNLIYQNVLDRAADGDGFVYWMNELNNGFSREAVLASFSESTENHANVAGAIADGIWYV